jgi:hypothetical protein
MGPDDLARADVRRCGEELFVEHCAEKHRMASAAVINRDGDQFRARIEGSEQLTYEIRGDHGVVYRADEKTFGGSGGKTANRGLNRRKLPLRPIGIDDDDRRIEANFRADFCRVRAEDHARDADSRMARDTEKVFEESRAVVGKQSLGFSHAAGFACGEDRGSKHFWFNRLEPRGCPKAQWISA